jgi:23S rRNA (guanosine2251-2'-O)-methyltransferase
MSKRRIRLLAYNIRSLWNVGAFFRTCDGLGIEHLYLTGYTPHPPRTEITKTAIGAELYVPWEHARDPLPVIEKLKKEGWQVVALELTKESIDLSLFKPSDKVCLIAGHELAGVPEQILELCDVVVEIPMHGKKESLNVSVAAGIALHALRAKS